MSDGKTKEDLIEYFSSYSKSDFLNGKLFDVIYGNDQDRYYNAAQAVADKYGISFEFAQAWNDYFKKKESGEKNDNPKSDIEVSKIVGGKIHQAVQDVIKANQDKYKPLTVVSAFDLNSHEYKRPEYIVDGILYPGLTIFAGPPKYGKSFLSLDLTCCVAAGNAFLDRPTKQGDVLYLDLEGKEWRTAERLTQLGYNLCPDRLDHTYEADTIDQNLLRQLKEWIDSKSNPKLIIIDTMARIKGKVRRGEDGYSAEYRFLTPLHDLALDKSISVICVTHTRKGNGLLVDDPMEMIHGSTAQFGTADNGWVLTGKREEATKVLHCSGRDYESIDLELEFSKGRWIPQGTVEDMEKRRAAASYNKDPAVRTIIYLVESNGGRWRGTMQWLFNEIASFTGEYPAADPTRLAHIVRSYMSLLKERNGIMTYIPSSARIIDGKSRKEYEFRQNGFTD